MSNGGGSEPVWSPDGRELYFLNGTLQLVAATVKAGATIEVTDLKPLFDASGLALDSYHTSYGVLPGGRGFVFSRQRQTERAAVQPALVEAENWFADVRARTKR